MDAVDHILEVIRGFRILKRVIPISGPNIIAWWFVGIDSTAAAGQVGNMAHDADIHVKNPVSAMTFKPLVTTGAVIVVNHFPPFVITADGNNR